MGLRIHLMCVTDSVSIIVFATFSVRSGHIPMSSPSMKTSFKVVLVGSSSVGKSSMVERLTEGIFPDDIQSTVGVEFKAFAVPVDDRTVRLQIWDTAGQERFKSVSKAYFRNAVGAVLMFDITQESTFEDLSTWLADL
jgi:small GTP-binding protein